MARVLKGTVIVERYMIAVVLIMQKQTKTSPGISMHW